MSHPLLRVVCLFAAGILLGFFGELRWSWLWMPLAGLSVATLLSARTRPFVWIPLLLLAGWFHWTLHTRIWSDHDLRLRLGNEPVLAQIRGRLVQTPRVTQHLRDETLNARTLAVLQVAQIQINHEPWIPATGRVAVSSPGTLSPDFWEGRAVTVNGVLGKPPGPRAAGLFDYATFLERKGIHFQLRASAAGDWTVDESVPARRPLTDRFVQWARGTLARGLPVDDPATGLLQAMTLGWKTALTDEIEKPFMQSGTMHIFAISGLHIALIAGILLAVLRLLRVPRGVCGAVLIPLLWFYTAATGWQASAVRATVMMTVILGGWSLRRPSNLLNSLAAAALLILLGDPRQLLQASFQLSFAVVLSLSLLLPPLQEQLLRSLQPDPLLPAPLVPRWKRWLGTPVRWVLLLAASSLAAWLGSVLLTAQYFHLFSPGTLLANVMVFPCASAALASALASLVTGAWCPWLSETFNHGAWFWMRCMMRISQSVSELPGAFRYVAAPSPALLVVYYGTLLTLAFSWVRPQRIKWFLGAAVLVGGMLLGWQMHQHRSSASLTVIPLNGGRAVTLKMPGSSTSVLADCGNTDTFEPVLAPFLHARGENQIRTLLLTHAAVRNMGTAERVLQDFTPRTVGLSPLRFRSSAYRQLTEVTLPALSPRTNLRTLSAGDQVDGWTVLHPSADLDATRADEGALVLHGHLQGTRILLLSDLNHPGQRRLLEQTDAGALASDIVIAGLPEDGEPLIEEILRRTQPALILVSDDEWPANRRASAEFLARLRNSGATVLRTREHGAVRVEFAREGWKATHPRGQTLAQSGRPQVEEPD